jgi:hypothetical protein
MARIGKFKVAIDELHVGQPSKLRAAIRASWSERDVSVKRDGSIVVVYPRARPKGDPK